MSVHRQHRMRGVGEIERSGLSTLNSVGAVTESNRIQEYDVGLAIAGDQNFSAWNRLSDNTWNIQVISEGGLIYANRTSAGETGLITTSGSSGDAQLVANRVSQATGYGIFSGTVFTILSDNTVKGSGLAGAFLDGPGALFYGNRLLSSGTDGIEADLASLGALLLNTSLKNEGLDLRAAQNEDNVFIDNKLKSTNIVNL